MIKPLLEDFYTEIVSTNLSAENTFTATVELNPAHKIYKGHFPEIPVAPGVSLIQVIQEVLAKKINKELSLKEGSNIKFLAMINPLKENKVTISYTIQLTEKEIDTTANIAGKEIIYVKFKGTFNIK
ncbi:MAG TPA: 3-hydroxyacyl-ACP dehydratase [Bacteroidia bacterium]|nr:3-hydroxyacyl-ACP dehydratase [Bacteroidia bacterium]